MSAARFTGPKFTAAHVLLWSTAVMVPGVKLGVPISDWYERSALVWHIEPDIMKPLPPDLGRERPGTQLLWGGDIQMTVNNASASDRLVAMLPALGISILIAAAAVTLIRLFNAAERGQPFAAASVSSLRLLAGLALAGGTLIPVVTWYADNRLAERAMVDPPTIGVTFPFVWLAVVVLLLALAEVFRIGSHLADEVEGLV